MNGLDKIIVFTRFPEPGKTKTRLIPHLGAEGAAQFQKEMTEHTVKQARKAGARIEIRYTQGSLPQMKNWLGDDLDYADQGEGDLGHRMQRAFVENFSKGAQKIVIIGADCPSNGWKNIQTAFSALEHNDVVIGPATDGGYYLIGLCQEGASIPPPRSCITETLFENIDWGGEQVFEQTVNAACGFRIHELLKLNDVDEVEDIPPKISVIIPTLNEEQHLLQTLEKAEQGFNVEIIVVDAGSADETLTISPGAMDCREGRAAQQNLGASNAAGELFLFLHADTELPDDWDWAIRNTLSDPSVALGAFSFKLKENVPGFKLIEATTNWRSRTCRLPYGDQGFFIRKSNFEASGGFPDLPIMEDYAFVRSLRGAGQIVTVPEAAATSGRRWLQHGIIKVTVLNWIMVLGFRMGVPPERLARLYRGS
jgi:rSAM/selenodomain-associated transferase 2/rSAM/selenodomain-associated transferase 1